MSSAELSTDWTQVTKTITSPLDAVTLKLELSGTQFSGWLAWDDANYPARSSPAGWRGMMRV